MMREIIERITADDVINLQELAAPNNIVFPATVLTTLPGRNKLGGLHLIHMAAYHNAIKCFKWLVEDCSIPIDHRSPQNYQPLHLACAGGAYDVFRYIVAHQPVEAIKSETDTPFQAFYLAVMSANIPMIKMLLDLGCDSSSTKNDRPNSDLIRFAIDSRNGELLQLLLPLYPRNVVVSGNTDLMYAIRRRSPCTEILIDSGEDASIYVEFRSQIECALSLACQQQDVKSVQLIMDKFGSRALPPPQYADILFPAHWMCASCSLEIANILLQYDIDVNAIDNKGTHAVEQFIGRGYCIPEEDRLRFLDILYAKGLNVNTRSKRSLLACFAGCVSLQPAIIIWILEHGGDPHAPMYAGSPVTVCEQLLKIPKTQSLFKNVHPAFA